MGLYFKIVYRKGKENLAADALSRVGHMMAIQAVSQLQPLWVQEVLNSYVTDASAQALQQSDDKGFSLPKGVIYYKGQVWIGNNTALRTKLIVAMHSTPIGGHSGVQATYYRLKKLFHRKGMKTDVHSFVKQCIICQQARHEHQHPAGLLQPLLVPAGAWQSLSMDFIEGLPKFDGYSVIAVVVDRFYKVCSLSSTQTPIYYSTSCLTVVR